MTRRGFAQIVAGSVFLASDRRRSAAQENDRAFTFGLVADVQYADADPVGSRYYREARGKLADCVRVLNQMDLAFVIQLGDLIDRDYSSFDAVVPIYDRLRSPHYHVLGNHDFSVD